LVINFAVYSLPHTSVPWSHQRPPQHHLHPPPPGSPSKLWQDTSDRLVASGGWRRLPEGTLAWRSAPRNADDYN
jgi:hypothetical protein